MFLGNPSLRNVEHLTAIFEHLPEAWPGIGVPTQDIPQLRQNLDPFHTVAERTAGRFRVETAIAGEASDEFDTELREAVTSVLDDDRFRALGIEGLSLVELLGPAVENRLRRRLPVLRSFAARFDELIQRESPAAVVVTPDRASEARVACSLAQRSGVPSVFPQVETFSRSPRFKTLQADYITVVDDDTRKMYRERFGVPDERIFVTGIPRFEGIARRRSSRRESAAASASKTVMVAMQPIAGDTNDQLLTTVADAIARLDDVRLLVKLHPGQSDSSLERYEQEMEQHPAASRIEVTKAGDIYDLIETCNVVVSMFSAVVLEAAIYGRLVICASLSGEPLPVPYVEQGVAAGAFSPDELRTSIAAAFGDDAFVAEARERQDAYFERNPHLRDGRSLERIAAVIDALARGEEPPRDGLQDDGKP